MKRSLIPALLGALLCVGTAQATSTATVAPAAPALPADATPSQIVRQQSDHMLKMLVAHRDAFRADPVRLHAFVDQTLADTFDREYSARLVLAQHSRGVSPQAIAAFADALTDNLMRRYGDALLDVDPKIDVRVRSETPLRGGAIMRVATEIERQGGAPVPVDYLFRDTEQGWKVFDVIVEGVSYVQTYRTQFAEQLRGRSLAQVTAELEQGRLAIGE